MNAIARAAAIVAHKDSGSFRQSAFAYLASHNRRVTLAKRAYAALGRGSWASTVLVSGYGLAAFLRTGETSGARVWAVGRYRNEERQFQFVERCLDEPVGRVGVGTSNILRLNTLRDLVALASSPAELKTALRIIHRYNGQGDFLISCRIAATAGFSARFKRIVARHPELRAVVVSSDTNPYATSICEVARDRGISRVYITHGHMPAGPPRVDFDLWLLDGPELREVYHRVAPVRGHVVYKGSEGEYRPMDPSGLQKPKLTVGIFASLLVDWQQTAEVISAVRRTLRPEKLIVRFHPNKTIRDPKALDYLPTGPDIEYSDGATVLTDDAKRCDLVLAGNSSCHLTVLKFGVPTAYVRGLDIVPHDFYGFLREGIVPSHEKPSELDPDALHAFYSAPEWRDRFRRFDAAYGAEEDSVSAKVRQALAALLDGRRPSHLRLVGRSTEASK